MVNFKIEKFDWSISANSNSFGGSKPKVRLSYSRLPKNCLLSVEDAKGAGVRRPNARFYIIRAVRWQGDDAGRLCKIATIKTPRAALARGPGDPFALRQGRGVGAEGEEAHFTTSA